MLDWKQQAFFLAAKCGACCQGVVFFPILKEKTQTNLKHAVYDLLQMFINIRSQRDNGFEQIKMGVSFMSDKQLFIIALLRIIVKRQVILYYSFSLNLRKSIN